MPGNFEIADCGILGFGLWPAFAGDCFTQRKGGAAKDFEIADLEILGFILPEQHSKYKIQNLK